MRFRHRPIEVDVVQWFNPGDHPAERKPHPMLPKGACTNLIIPNGISGGTLDLHPGDYIVTFEDGRHEVLTGEELHRRFEPVPISHGSVHFHHTS